ncbi:hypothetical protein MAR_034147 [Mya arenaria]|uniref:Secreted protein n=1 Tax=Mya arenaria TaxID=6604 RepID=A0ABY7GBZ1_MYAAR|nr:hypothetical protein MAR_034147 [Mya arenaria]
MAHETVTAIKRISGIVLIFALLGASQTLPRQNQPRKPLRRQQQPLQRIPQPQLTPHCAALLAFLRALMKWMSFVANNAPFPNLAILTCVTAVRRPPCPTAFLSVRC